MLFCTSAISSALTPLLLFTLFFKYYVFSIRVQVADKFAYTCKEIFCLFLLGFAHIQIVHAIPFLTKLHGHSFILLKITCGPTMWKNIWCAQWKIYFSRRLWFCKPPIFLNLYALNIPSQRGPTMTYLHEYDNYSSVSLEHTQPQKRESLSQHRMLSASWLSAPRYQHINQLLASILEVKSAFETCRLFWDTIH